MNFLKSIQFKKEHLIFFCLLLGAIVTFENIQLLDFWLDEAGVAIAIHHSFWEVGKISVAYSQSILYNYGVKTWTLIFSESPLAIRSFSVFCYLALIAMMYKAGTYFFKDKKIGLFAAFLAATNYFSIWYAIEAKVYTLAALISLLSYYFFIKSLRKSDWKNYLFYFFFSALGSYAHPWLFLVFGSQIIGSLVFRKYLRNFFQIALIQFLIFLASVPFIFLTLAQGRLGINSYIGRVYWWNMLDSFSYLSFGSSWLYLGLTLIALFFVIKDMSFFRNLFYKIISKYFPENGIKNKKVIEEFSGGKKGEQIINIMLIIYLLVPMITAMIISQFKPAYLVGRYEMAVLPAFLLILANLWMKIKEKIWLSAIIILILFFSMRSVIGYQKDNGNYRSTDKTVIADIFSKADTGDYIIATDLSWATAYYYATLEKSGKKLNITAYPQEISQHPVWKNMEQMLKNREKYFKEGDDLIAKIKNDSKANQIFVLYKLNNELNEDLREKLDQNFEFIKEDYPKIPREPSWFDYILIYRKK